MTVYQWMVARKCKRRAHLNSNMSERGWRNIKLTSEVKFSAKGFGKVRCVKIWTRFISYSNIEAFEIRVMQLFPQYPVQ